jgi:hypothetical protein
MYYHTPWDLSNLFLPGTLIWDGWFFIRMGAAPAA